MGLLTKPIKTLDDLFVHTLQDIYYAEQQITKALPKMISKVSNPDLKQGLQDHLQQTKNLIAWARELGHDDWASVLEQTLEEEKAADLKLTEVAEARLNRLAARR